MASVDALLRAQFKLEVKKPTSNVLNAMLDSDQTRVLYRIKERKATLARKKKLLKQI